MGNVPRVVLAGIVAAAAAVAFTAPAQARVDAVPGPWCGGSLWKLMTVSDSARNTVRWAPATTSVSDIAHVAPPAKVAAARTTPFQKQVWKLPNIVIERYRVASNGEVVLELFDIASATYMNAYLPNPDCLPATTRGRSSILAARNAFLGKCPAPTTGWQMLGATAQLAGVGFWNPIKTTVGALANGAELRPVTSLTITQGCGVF
jgi:hypothetical protein